jgi:hypothetical protein
VIPDVGYSKMNKKSKTCYMCEALATSDEHVPPKCIFPEKKDLPAGMDLKRNLFTVPACDAHNSKKSHDDEYFLYVLSGSFQINDDGKNLYVTKLRRAIKRNPSVLKKIAATATPVKIADPISGNIVNSTAHKLDEDRFNTIIDRLSRAIYFHHFQEKWLGHVKYQAEFLFATAGQSDESNIRIKAISKDADEWFSEAIYYGENPSVFKYQAIENNESRKMRLHFYEGCKLLLIFDSQQQL